MKKKWAVALAALTAAVIPYSRKKDPETGAVAIQALLWRYARNGAGDMVLTIGLCLGKNELPQERPAEKPVEDASGEAPEEVTEAV
jgi:hypothetical protein